MNNPPTDNDILDKFLSIYVQMLVRFDMDEDMKKSAIEKYNKVHDACQKYKDTYYDIMNTVLSNMKELELYNEERVKTMVNRDCPPSSE